MLREIQEQGVKLGCIEDDMFLFKGLSSSQNFVLTISRMKADAETLTGFTEPNGENAAHLKTRVIDGILKTKVDVAVAFVERLDRIRKMRVNTMAYYT